MPSKFDLLREGKAIEFEPGVSGRLNPQTRKLELSTGEVLDASNDPDFYPKNEKALKLSRQKESVEKGARNTGGEFFHQFANQGLIGGATDWVSYLSQTGDEYVTRKQAEQQVSQRISEQSPYTSGAATAASFATDIAATRGMSALKAAPLLTLGSAGSRIATEPGEVAGETLMSAGLGYGLDKVGGYLNRVAQRRGASRAIPGQQQAVVEANALQAQEFNALKQNVKNINESRLKQHQTELNARQNRMIESQNNYEKAKLARDAEVMKAKNQFDLAKSNRSAETSRLEAEYKAAKSSADAEGKRLQDEYKQAQQRYEQSIKEMPKLQAEAQREYSQNVINRANEIEKSFPKGSRISSLELDIPGFIETRLSKTGLAGSTESARVTRILKSLFPEGEYLTAKDISGRYKAIEEAIQRSNPEVKGILNEFKNHLGDKLPIILSNNMSYERVVPSLTKQLGKDIESVFKKFPKGMTIKSIKKLEVSAKNNASKYFEKLTPSELIDKIKNGEFRQEFLENVFSEGGKSVMNAEGKVIGTRNFPDYVKVLEDMFVGKLDDAIAKAELKMIGVETDAAKRLGANVKRTKGLAEPIAPPQPPNPVSPVAQPMALNELPPVIPPNMPPPIQSTITPPIPGKPSLMGIPEAPVPMAEPILQGAQGMAERTGDLLEKPILSGGRGLTNNPLIKLGGLKYLLGGAAVPAEAAYLGMKGLTSPTVAGQAARMSFKQSGIQAIEQMAQKYPSYNNGILDNPQDRRSLTKEIEDDFEIPIEQKAVLQSKVNRGKPLQERL